MRGHPHASLVQRRRPFPPAHLGLAGAFPETRACMRFCLAGDWLSRSEVSAHPRFNRHLMVQLSYVVTGGKKRLPWSRAIRFKLRVSQLPDLSHLSHAEKDALIRALWECLEMAERRIADLEARLSAPSKTSDNSSLPPSKGQKPNKPEKAKHIGPRKGSLGRKGGGGPLSCDPDETVTAKAAACLHCQAVLTDADQVLHGRYDKIDLQVMHPIVTREERYAGHCPCCGGVTLAPVPAGLEDGSPFSVNILALAIYLRRE
jgi:hypothetical protein